MWLGLRVYVFRVLGVGLGFQGFSFQPRQTKGAGDCACLCVWRGVHIAHFSVGSRAAGLNNAFRSVCVCGGGCTLHSLGSRAAGLDAFRRGVHLLQGFTDGKLKGGPTNPSSYPPACVLVAAWLYCRGRWYVASQPARLAAT